MRVAAIAESEVRRIWKYDLPAYEAEGWQVCTEPDGSIRQHWRPSGVEVFVKRKLDELV